MKRIAATVLLLIISILTYSQVEKVRLASDIWPPFTDSKGNTAFAVDLVKLALSRTGITVESDILDFPKVLESIQSGETDGSAALWKDINREKYMYFSDPYLHNQLILVGKKGSDVSQASLQELKGRTVGIVESYAYGSSIEEAAEVHWIPGKSDHENLQKLVEGEIDYILIDALLIQYLLNYQREKALQHIVVGENVLIKKSLHFAVRKDLEGAEELMKRFNNEVIKMIADGSYHRVLQLNWIQADVDGDGTVELVLNGNKAGDRPPQNTYSVFSSSQSSSVSSQNTKYYIGGNFYQSWDKVPQEYKQAQIKNEDLSKIGIASFRF